MSRSSFDPAMSTFDPRFASMQRGAARQRATLPATISAKDLEVADGNPDFSKSLRSLGRSTSTPAIYAIGPARDGLRAPTAFEARAARMAYDGAEERAMLLAIDKSTVEAKQREVDKKRLDATVRRR